MAAFGVGAPPDPRFQWVEDVVVPALKVKAERFRKLCSSEPDLYIIRDFLDSSEKRTIFFSDGAKELQVFAKPPAGLKKKMVYLLKGEGGPLTAESIRSAVLFGDLHPKPLDGLLQSCADVYLPLISSPANQQGWPDVVATEVTEVFHSTVAAICIALGQAQGKTILPLPPAQMLVADPSGYGAKDRIHVLETSVVTWTTQIKNVLKLDPEHILAQGHPGPLAGLEFWAAKAANLDSMMQQLHGEKIRKGRRAPHLLPRCRPLCAAPCCTAALLRPEQRARPSSAWSASATTACQPASTRGFGGQGKAPCMATEHCKMMAASSGACEASAPLRTARCAADGGARGAA